MALAPEQVALADYLNAEYTKPPGPGWPIFFNDERRSLEEESSRARPWRKSTGWTPTMPSSWLENSR